MMNYFSNRKKWMAYLILLTFMFTCIVPTNLAGGNSIAEAAGNEGKFTVQYYADLQTANEGYYPNAEKIGYSLGNGQVLVPAINMNEKDAEGNLKHFEDGKLAIENSSTVTISRIELPKSTNVQFGTVTLNQDLKISDTLTLPIGTVIRTKTTTTVDLPVDWDVNVAEKSVKLNDEGKLDGDTSFTLKSCKLPTDKKNIQLGSGATYKIPGGLKHESFGDVKKIELVSGTTIAILDSPTVTFKAESIVPGSPDNTHLEGYYLVLDFDNSNRTGTLAKTDVEETKLFNARKYALKPSISIEDLQLESEIVKDKYQLSAVFVGKILGKDADNQDIVDFTTIYTTETNSAKYDNQSKTIRKVSNFENLEFENVTNDTVIRFVYDPVVSSEVETGNVVFYDYNVGEDTDGNPPKGINNSADVNSGNKKSRIAFGTSNSGHHYDTWGNGESNSYWMNARSGENDFQGGLFGLTEGLTSDGKIDFAAGVQAPLLYGETADGTEVSGRKTIGNRELLFNRDGDTYTLVSVAGGTSLDEAYDLNQLSNTHEVDGVYDLHPMYWGNQFWPINSNGSENDVDTKRNNKEENEYFGMHHTVDFELGDVDGDNVLDYAGPLNYYFYGDNDMWVFLSKKTYDNSTENPIYSDAKLVCDLGGLHNTLGGRVDLWDFIDENNAEESAGTYTLHVFFMERGGSGSACFMQYTLPSVRPPSGDLKISKTVVDDTDAKVATGQAFTFKIGLNDNTGNANEYDYTIHNSNDGSLVDNVVRTVTSGRDDNQIELKDGQYAQIHYLPAGTTYTVTETANNAYTTTINGNTIGTIEKNVTAKVDFVNTLKVISISGEKIWSDIGTDKHEDDIVTINLLRDGKPYKSTTVSALNWKFNFGTLPKHAIKGAVDADKDADGHEFVYQVQEVVPDGYIPSYYKQGDDDKQLVAITNHPKDDDSPRTISGEKIWADGRDGHGEIEIKLFGNDKTKEVATTRTSLQWDWKYSFTNLPKYENGEWINYTVKETPVDGYITNIIPTVEGFDIYNTPYVESIGDVSVGKVVTVETGATAPPDSTQYEFNLLLKAMFDPAKADPAVAKEKALLEKAKTDAETAYSEAEQDLQDAWSAFDAKVQITSPSAYEFIMTDSNDDAMLGSVTSPSVLVYKLNKSLINVQDAGQDILARVKTTIQNLATKFKELTEQNAVEFMEQFARQTQSSTPSAIIFSMNETNNVLNKIFAEKEAKELKKNTADAYDNFAKPEPTAVEVYEVKANGDKEHVVSYTPKDWSNDLDGYNVSFKLFRDEIKHFIFEATTGTAITFKVNETRPNLTDYHTTDILTKDGQSELGTLTTKEYELATGSSYGFTFNNIFKPTGGGGGGENPTITTTSRSVEKVWNDNGNPNRPTSITVNLLKNGEPVESVVLSAANSWSYEWTGLENGPTWSVVEVDVPSDYAVSVTNSGVKNFIITNTYITPVEDPDETIPDDNVPTGSVEPGIPLDELDEPEIPLGDAPATGDTNNAAPFMALLVMAIAGLVITRRKFN